MNPSRPDVVFDCNVFFQAIARENGPAAKALRMVESKLVTLHVSRAVLRELRRVLGYPELRDRNPHVTNDLVEAFLARVAFRAVLSRRVPHVFEYPRDPQDEPYVDLAAAVQADYLVTRDKDLLSLATDYSVEAKHFRQRFPRLRIVDPVEFVNAIESISGPTGE